ncbi:MAG: DUF4013 domain-containing protein [Candidatus Aenigmarchaeota archaeon]|nr:DUF4013 domain-containing protein [Candidatus Aenigmarchaeota archaeon]
MSFTDAVKRPFQDFKTLIIGIIVMIIPIVNLIGIGYFLECARTSLKKDKKLPEFKDWLNLFIKGLVAAVIGIIYAIPVLIILALTVGTAVLTGGASALTGMQGAALMQTLATLGIGFVITLVVAAIVSLISSAAMIRYAEKGNFGSAFELSVLMKKAFTGKYFAAWFISMLYSLAVVIILSFIPVVGTLIGAFVVGVTTYTYLAEAYRSA